MCFRQLEAIPEECYEMEVEDGERTLLKHMEEFRRRPSKVSAEFFYHSKTNESWKLIEKILFIWLDIYSELESFEGTNFDELSALVRNIRAHDKHAEILRTFYLLRTRTRDILENKVEVMKKLATSKTPKAVICRIYMSLLDSVTENIYEDVTSVTQDEDIAMTRSILSMLPKNHLTYLKTKLTESHSRSHYGCPCKLSKVARFRKIGIGKNHSSDGAAKCHIMIFINELNILLDTLSSFTHDLSPIHTLHLQAGRTDLARHFYIKHKDKIHRRRPSCSGGQDGDGRISPPIAKKDTTVTDSSSWGNGAVPL